MTNPQFQSSHSTNLESIVDHSAWFSNSARVRESKTVLDYGFRQFVASGTWILDSGFWILDSGFWILDSGFGIRGSGFESLVGFRIPRAGFRIQARTQSFESRLALTHG